MKRHGDRSFSRCDRMDSVSLVLKTAILFAFAVFLAMGLDIGLRSADQHGPARVVSRSLGTSTLALWPPGHPLNQPLAVHPGVDLRLAPNLPRPIPRNSELWLPNVAQ